jgi:pimeloyl-ACP methyl ester carboxylesterase
MSHMATFVIVHGGWGGGWEWTDVARKLRQQGHEVFTPTLTGLGEREHLGGQDTGLSDHIEDVVKVLEFEQLTDVVLCGHSYGGMVVTGAADRVAERIRLLVYVDAFVPDDGQAGRDLVPPEFAEEVMRSADERGDGRFPIPEDLLPPEGALSAERREAYIMRLRPQTLPTFTEPVRLSGAVDELARAFVRCTTDDIMAPFAERALAEGWTYRELATPHDPQLFDPEAITAILDDLATSVRHLEPSS